jgi:hypothetical protein
MNKSVIIIGGLTIIGVGAYLFFKPKKVSKDSVNQLDTDTTTAVPQKGTQLTTPEQVEEMALKIAEARELTKTICDLKKQFKITNDNINDFMNITGLSIGTTSSVFGSTSSSISNSLQYQISRKKALQTIADSINKLAKLGYREDNCKTTRITPLPF